MRDVDVIIHTPDGGTYPATIGREVTVRQLLRNVVETIPLDENITWIVTDRRTGRVLDAHQTFEGYPASERVELNVAPAHVPTPAVPEPIPSRTPALLWYIVGFVLVALVFLYLIGRD